MRYYKIEKEKVTGFLLLEEPLEILPENCVEITEEEYAAYLAAQAKPQD